ENQLGEIVSQVEPNRREINGLRKKASDLEAEVRQRQENIKLASLNDSILTEIAKIKDDIKQLGPLPVQSDQFAEYLQKLSAKTQRQKLLESILDFRMRARIEQ
ncbi:MAG: hypothetical protein EZS28_044582, partial [Streblomastix strix]